VSCRVSSGVGSGWVATGLWGVNNWHLSWDGTHTTHRFGDNVPPHLKSKLVNKEHPENVARWNEILAERSESVKILAERSERSVKAI